MKKSLCVIISIILIYCLSTGYTESSLTETEKLVIVKMGNAYSLNEMEYAEREGRDLLVIGNSNCTPAWVAQQIDSGNDTVDIFSIKTNMQGYRDLLNKGYCASINEMKHVIDHLDQMPKSIKSALGDKNYIYAVPESISWTSSSYLVCDTTHPLWEEYNLASNHSIESILHMLIDLSDQNRLDEYWLWSDHADVGHLYNLCIVGCINYLIASNQLEDVESDRYRDLFRQFDRVRTALLNRNDPYSMSMPLFYPVNLGNESLISQENKAIVLMSPFPDQEDFLQISLQVYIMNPKAPHYNQIADFFNFIVESYTPFQSLCFSPNSAEPIEDSHYEITKTRWIISPELISWYQQYEGNIYVVQNGLLSSFWDNSGLSEEKKYFEGYLSIDDYMDFFLRKLKLLKAEEE